MALGAIILGYRIPEVIAAVQTAANNGPVYTLPSILEGELAELLSEECIISAEMVRFCKNGEMPLKGL